MTSVIKFQIVQGTNQWGVGEIVMINIGKGYSWVTVLVLQLFCCCENLQNMNLGIKEMNIASGRYNEEI